MSGRCVLAIDQGTTSSRALLFDAAGRVLGAGQHPFAQHFPQPGWVEHDAEEILATVRAAVRDAIASAGVQASDIAAIGIANQRETTVVWDRDTGKPVHRAIVWQSRQTEAICEELRATGHDAVVRERTGLLIDPYFSATKLRWLLDACGRDPSTLLFGTIDTWLAWNLTRERVHVTDAGNASRTLLYDIHARRWCPDLAARLGAPPSMLPRVVPNSGIVGHAEASLCGAPVPVAGLAGDQQAALFGQACFEAGMAKNTYGTGCFLLMNTGPRAVRSTQGLLTTIAWELDGETHYALEGSVYVAGAAVQWLRDGLHLIATAAESQQCAERAASSEGVYMVPAFVGLGAPHWRSDARGAVFGLTRGTGRDTLVRAVLESLAYQTCDVLDAMQADAGIALSSLRADGGAIANDFLAQFQADLAGVPLERPAVLETTALGAAYFAGLATGFWRDRADIARQRRTERRFEPAMAGADRASLRAGWRRAVKATLAFADG